MSPCQGSPAPRRPGAPAPRRPNAPAPRRPGDPAPRRPGAQGTYDELLFDELRALRKRLADAEGKPPYIVFGDATLVQMARRKPLEEDALLAISGVGQHKLKKYGPDFLAAIAEYTMAEKRRGE